MNRRHRTILLSAMCAGAVFLTTPPIAAADDVAATTALAGANGLLNRGLYDLAAAEYEQFLNAHATHSKVTDARYALGVCRFHLGRYDEALQELGLVPLRGHDYAVEAALVRGQCHLRLGRYVRAADALDLVLREHQGHPLFDDAAALQAEALYLGGSHDRVAQACELLVQHTPDSPQRERVDLIWSISDMARGQHAAAADRLRSMRQRFADGEHADQAALLLAQCLHRLRDLPGAATAYRTAADTGNDQHVPDALYGLGSVLYEQGRPEAAGPVLDDLLQRYPTHDRSTAATVLRGRAWLDVGDANAAASMFDTLLSTNRNPDVAAYWRAKCELRLGDAAGAAGRLGRALETYPRSALRPEMHFDRAVALTRADQPGAAVDALEAFRHEFPKHRLAPEALHLMAAAEHDRGEFDRSSTHCRAFTTAFPTHALAPRVAFLDAENAYRSARYDDAVTRYRAWLDAHPTADRVPAATYRLGMSLYRLDRPDEAEPLLRSAVAGAETPDTFRSAWLALGDLNFQRDDWASAEEFLQAYLDGGVDQAAADDALLKLGLARHRNDDLDGAIDAYGSLIDAFPDGPLRRQAIFERGQALVELKRPDTAVQDFRQVIELAPDSVFAFHAHQHLAVIAAEGQRYEAAAGHYGQSASIAPNADQAAESMLQEGRALISAQRFERAAAALGRLLRQHPNSASAPEAQARAAMCLARLDRHDEALASIKALSPNVRAALDARLRAALAYEQAWCHRSLNQNDDAATAYRRLLDMNDRHELQDHARLELAELEANAGRHTAAAELLDPLVANTAHRLAPQATYRLAVSRYHLEEFATAASLLEQYLKTDVPADIAGSAALLCGEAHFRAGAHQRAIPWLRRVAEPANGDDIAASALLRLGECAAVLQDWSGSEQAFTEHRRRFPDSDLWFQAQFGIGWARENQNRHTEAIDAYRAVPERHRGETAARAQFQIGECHYALQQYEPAVREFLKVDILYAYPEWTAAALYEAGCCFEALGRRSESREHLERVARDHAGTRWAELAAERLSRPSRSSLPGHR